MLAPKELEDLVKYCNEKGITYISDEIYHGIVFDHERPQQTALEYSDDVIIMKSFSKYYSMPGWRVVWMVVPDYMVDRLAAIARNLYISPAAASQHVALKAMDCTDDLDKHIERYRRSMEEELAVLGFAPVYVQALLAHAPDDLVAVEFEPDEAYDQTPGAQAGSPLLAQ